MELTFFQKSCDLLIESLSKDNVEQLTSTGSVYFFQFWMVVLPKFYNKSVSTVVKTHRNTNLVSSRPALK